MVRSRMMIRTDIRFCATPSTTAAVKTVELPIRVMSRSSTTQSALAAARQVVDAFSRLCETTRRPDATISVLAANPDSPQRSGILSVLQRSAKESQVELEFIATVNIDGPAEFWHRADAIAWAVDVVQSFSARTWPKGVWVFPRRARLSADAANSEETVGEPEA